MLKFKLKLFTVNFDIIINFNIVHALYLFLYKTEGMSRYSINTYVQYLSYALLVIAELPNDELTGNHTLSLSPLCL